MCGISFIISKNKINIINEEKRILIQSFEEIKRNEINEKTEELRINREKLEKEINYLKQLYVEKSKGIKYESELIPKFEEYNDNKLNNKWRILHIGSSLNHKCDFHFLHFCLLSSFISCILRVNH